MPRVSDPWFTVEDIAELGGSVIKGCCNKSPLFSKVVWNMQSHFSMWSKRFSNNSSYVPRGALAFAYCGLCWVVTLLSDCSLCWAQRSTAHSFIEEDTMASCTTLGASCVSYSPGKEVLVLKPPCQWLTGNLSCLASRLQVFVLDNANLVLWSLNISSHQLILDKYIAVSTHVHTGWNN